MILPQDEQVTFWNFILGFSREQSWISVSKGQSQIMWISWYDVHAILHFEASTSVKQENDFLYIEHHFKKKSNLRLHIHHWLWICLMTSGMATASPTNRWAAFDIYYHLQNSEKAIFFIHDKSKKLSWPIWLWAIPVRRTSILCETKDCNNQKRLVRLINPLKSNTKVNKPLKVQCSIEEKQLCKCGIPVKSPTFFYI